MVILEIEWRDMEYGNYLPHAKKVILQDGLSYMIKRVSQDMVKVNHKRIPVIKLLH